MVPDAAVVVHINIRVRCPETVAEQVMKAVKPAGTDEIVQTFCLNYKFNFTFLLNLTYIQIFLFNK